jgi:hypothetical protein
MRMWWIGFVLAESRARPLDRSGGRCLCGATTLYANSVFLEGLSDIALTAQARRLLGALRRRATAGNPATLVEYHP